MSRKFISKKTRRVTKKRTGGVKGATKDERDSAPSSEEAGRSGLFGEDGGLRR